MLLAVLTSLLTASALGAERLCASGSAVYGLESSGYSLTVHGGLGAPPTVALRSEATGVTYRFLTTVGNGYAADALTPERDGRPIETAHPVLIYALGADLTVYAEFPRTVGAPEYVFAPELGRLLWYEAEALGGPTTASGVRESLPRGLFRFERCGDAAAS